MAWLGGGAGGGGPHVLTFGNLSEVTDQLSGLIELGCLIHV